MRNYVNDDLFIILAAVFGALTSALLSEALNWGQKSTILLTGAGFAIFVGPAACEYLNIVSPYAIGAVLYAGGVLGNYVLIRSLSWAKNADFVQVIVDHYKGKGPS